MIYLVMLLVLLCASPSHAATLASDNFTNSDGTNLPTHDGNWSTSSSCCNNNMVILSNGVRAAGQSGNIYTGATWPANQWSQATMTAVADKNQGVLLRADATALTYYFCGQDQNNSGHTRYLIDRYVAGARTGLWAHATQTMATNDVVYCEIQGSTLLLKVNDIDISGSVVDGSPISSGNAGITGRHDAADLTIIDTWSGGDFLSGGGGPGPGGDFFFKRRVR